MHNHSIDNKCRVLLIEDDEVDRRSVIRALNSAYDMQFICISAIKIVQASQYLSENQYDVIITDLNLPDSKNMDTINTLLNQNHKAPIIVLSGVEDESLALEAVHAGADDFISKQYIHDKCLIVRTVRHAMERHRLKMGLEATRDRERYLAHYDQITKLPNRLLFLDRIFQAVVQSQRSGEQFTLFFLDLDRFKSINDSLGHGAGDEVLRCVGARLLKSIRSSDTVARLGGDEFTVILRNTYQRDHLRQMAEQIIDDINQPIAVGRHKCSVGTSVGITCYPQHGDTAEQLLKNADIAMYEAKHRGRNQFRFFSKKLSDQNQHAFEIEVALKDALQHPNTQLSLHYQPKINLLTEQVTSVEGLIRWQHPISGNISPNQFIPLAEEVGLIEQIDEWVLRQACQQLNDWCDQGLDPVPIGINISGRSFNQRHFVNSTIIPILEEYQVDGQWLEIEITEGILLSDIEQVQLRLATLKNLGLRIAIDDFGTGFSSLSYLSNIPIDTLKIDASFICDSQCNRKDKAVLKAIIALGKALEVNVVAEGVETTEQKKFLQQLFCHEGQGFLWGKPKANWLPQAPIHQLSSTP